MVSPPAVHPRFRRFACFPPDKRLELKSFKGQTKAEELRPPTQNLLSKTPYKFKKSYGGTSEPQTAEDAPWLHETSLKNLMWLSYSNNIMAFSTT
jgi:hypothetical protein